MAGTVSKSALPSEAQEWGDIRPVIVSKALNANGESGGLYDPAFTDNRTQRVHRWVPWIAGYSARFVDEVLDKYLPKSGRPLVLDPFAGVGTTLFQAMLRDCDTLGFEINPFASLATRVKLSVSRIEPGSIVAAANRYRLFMARNAPPQNRPPKGFRSRIPFFSPKVEPKILRTLDFIESVEDGGVRDLFRLALGAVLVSVSNYTYEPSLGSRPGAGKPLIENADVAGLLTGKVLQMADDVAAVHRMGVTNGTHRVHTDNFLEYAHYTGGRKADLAITSPPYVNNYHYVRSTRPHLWWLGLIQSPDELRNLEHCNIGKFWQTVRGQSPVELDFEHPELQRIVTLLRRTRVDAGIYGGPGWANYVCRYFNDTYRYLTVLRKALKPDGFAVIVVGNSIVQGVDVQTDTLLADIAGMTGFERMAIDRLRHKRVGDSIKTSSVRYGQKGKAELYESAVVLRRK